MAHERRFNPYSENGGTILAIAGQDFAVIAGDTRQSEGYNIQTRYAPKVFHLSVVLPPPPCPPIAPRALPARRAAMSATRGPVRAASRAPARPFRVQRADQAAQDGQGGTRRQRLCRGRKHVRQARPAAARGACLPWCPSGTVTDPVLLYSGTSTRIIRTCPFARSPA